MSATDVFSSGSFFSMTAPPVGWQNNMSRIEQSLQYMYTKGLHTDIDFLVKCDDRIETFSCHKFVLQMWSPVFASIFQNSTNKDMREMEITGLTLQGFGTLLRYTYGLIRTPFKTQNHKLVVETYRAAEMFRVEALRRECLETIDRVKVTTGNVCDLLDVANFMNSEDLRQRCRVVIEKDMRGVLVSPDFHLVPESTVLTILEVSKSNLESEYELVNCILEWGRARMNDGDIRSAIDNFLPHIDFPSLSGPQFKDILLAEKDLLTSEEGFAIFMNIFQRFSWKMPSWHVPRKPREYPKK